MLKTNNIRLHQSGFSLVELMVGLVIGLFATLVVMQVFTAFEGQKRTTSGTADAQTNGSIALMMLQRHIQSAGYGLPMPNADATDNSLRCNAFPDFVDPVTGGTTNIFPLEITDGASDSVRVRFSTTALGAVPVDIINPANASSPVGLSASSNIGCADNDIALVINSGTCALTKVQDGDGGGGNTNIRLYAAATPAAATLTGGKIACMGNWQDYNFQVVNNELQLNGQPLVSEVVNMQAQYGISANQNSNNVTAWVDADAAWANPNIASRNRIKAIRIAVVLRNNLQEKQINGASVSQAAPIAWVPLDPATSPAPVINLAGNWQDYRYRVFETIIPIRNMLWSRSALQ